MRRASCFRGALCLLVLLAATAAVQSRVATPEPSHASPDQIPPRDPSSTDAQKLGTAPCTGSAIAVRYSSVRKAKISIPVTVNHSGPYAFLLDTSSQLVVLEPSLAEELHLEPRRHVQMISVSGNSAAQLVMPEVIQVGPYAVSAPLSAVGSIRRLKAIDPRIRGVLGATFLSHFDVLLDNTRRLLCLDNSGAMRQSIRGEHVPLVHPPGPGDADLPEPTLVRVRFEEERSPAVLALDSGANLPVLFSMLPNSASLVGRSLVVGPDQFFVRLSPQTVRIGAQSRIAATFFAPVTRQAAVASPLSFDGLLPTALFHRVFISYSEHYVIFNPE